jgi:hypothetical protein
VLHKALQDRDWPVSNSKSEIQFLKNSAFTKKCRILDCKKIVETPSTRSTLRKNAGKEPFSGVSFAFLAIFAVRQGFVLESFGPILVFLCLKG